MGLFSGASSYTALLGPLMDIFKSFGIDINQIIPPNQKIPNDEYENRTTILNSALTNALSFYTNQANNQFNAEQAALNRDFNAEQAQISRDWNSEEAVMARREAAGLNTAMVGGAGTSSSGGSSASASGTPASAAGSPSFSSPTLPLRTPVATQVAEIVNAATSGIKNISDAGSTIKQTAPLVDKLTNEAMHAGQLSRYQAILSDMTPELVTAQIGEIITNTEYARANKDLLPVIGQRNLLDTYKQVGDMYEQFVNIQLQQADRQLSVEELKTNWEALGQRLYHDSIMRKNELKSQNFRFAWSLRHKQVVSQTHDSLVESSSLEKAFLNSRSNFATKDWSIDGNIGLMGKLGSDLAARTISGKFDIGGRYGRSSGNSGSVTSSNSESTGSSALSGTDFTSSAFEFDFDSKAYKDAVNSIADSLIIVDPSSSYQQRLDALSRIYKINTSGKAFSEYLMRNVKAPMNDIFSNEFQQFPAD